MSPPAAGTLSQPSPSPALLKATRGLVHREVFSTACARSLPQGRQRQSRGKRISSFKLNHGMNP